MPTQTFSDAVHAEFDASAAGGIDAVIGAGDAVRQLRDRIRTECPELLDLAERAHATVVDAIDTVRMHALLAIAAELGEA